MVNLAGLKLAKNHSGYNFNFKQIVVILLSQLLSISLNSFVKERTKYEMTTLFYFFTLVVYSL